MKQRTRMRSCVIRDKLAFLMAHGYWTVSTAAACYLHQIHHPCGFLGHSVSRIASLAPMGLPQLAAPPSARTHPVVPEDSEKTMVPNGLSDRKDRAVSNLSKNGGIFSNQSRVRIEQVAPRCRSCQISLRVTTYIQS